MKEKNVVVVLGLSETGLGIGRSLISKRIKVFGLDVRKDIGFYSNHIESALCPDPFRNEIEFIQFLVKFGNQFSLKPVIMICSDTFLKVISLHRVLLSKHFQFNLSDPTILSSIMDKWEQYILASNVNIKVPKTFLILNIEDLLTSKNKFRFPILIKAREVNSWRENYSNTKVLVAQSFEELLEKFLIISEKGLAVICQQIILGPDTNHFKYCAYFNNGREISSFTLQKIRQFPINYGIGSMVKSVENEKVMKLGKEFFEKINYSGIGSAEFKLDQNDNQLKLIELNPRYWQQNSLSTICGINFPYIEYLDQTSQLRYTNTKFKKGIKWINIYADYNAYLEYRRLGTLNFFQWIMSLTGERTFSDFSWNDLKPWFRNLKIKFKISHIVKIIRKSSFL